MGSVEALPAFIAALKDSNRGGRERSASALGDIGDRQAVPALIAALDEWDRRVRERVVMALGKLGDRQAVPALLSALRDLRGSSPRSVGTALALLGGDQAWEGVLNAAEGGSLSLTPRIATLLGGQGMSRLCPDCGRFSTPTVGTSPSTLPWPSGSLGTRLRVPKW